MVDPLPLDLDEILAAQAEALGEPHDVVWGGEHFLVPRTDYWPLETFDLLGQGEMAAAVAGILGDDWTRFYNARPPTMGAVNVLLDSIAQREGFTDMGKSAGLRHSPNRATRRLKPTSSATTA